MKSLLEKIEKKVYWGIIGFLLALAFGVLGVYSYYHEKKPSLLFEIVNETNVLDVHKTLDNLTIYFNNEDIQKKNLNLRIITLQISNNGEVDILQSYYDQKMKWGFKIRNGKIINDARIINSNSQYLKNNISPKVLGDDTVEFEKVIFEKDKHFSLEILVIHDKNKLPEVDHMGKIVGIETVTPVKTWEKNLEKNFLDELFYGGFLINILRFIFVFVVIIISILFIFFVISRIEKRQRTIKDRLMRKTREQEIFKLFGNAPKDEKMKFIIHTYLNNSRHSDYLKELETIINNPDRLRMAMKVLSFQSEYNRNVAEMEKAAGSDELALENIKHLKDKLYWYYDCYLNDLLKINAVVTNSNNEIEVDPEFRKTLSEFLKIVKW